MQSVMTYNKAHGTTSMNKHVEGILRNVLNQNMLKMKKRGPKEVEALKQSWL
jgi:hypothetical protein